MATRTTSNGSGAAFYQSVGGSKIALDKIKKKRVLYAKTEAHQNPVFGENNKSFYGTPIPIGYGRRRTNGVHIWAGPSTVTQEIIYIKKENTDNFSRVYANFAVAFGAPGLYSPYSSEIIRLWADGELIYDKLAAKGEVKKAGVTFTLYHGSDDQEPDPTIVKYQGTSAVAFRGMVYAVFTDFLINPNTAPVLPVISAEIADTATGKNFIQFLDTDHTTNIRQSLQYDNVLGLTYVISDDGLYLKVNSIKDNTLLRKVKIRAPKGGFEVTARPDEDPIDNQAFTRIAANGCKGFITGKGIVLYVTDNNYLVSIDTITGKILYGYSFPDGNQIGLNSQLVIHDYIASGFAVLMTKGFTDGGTVHLAHMYLVKGKNPEGTYFHIGEFKYITKEIIPGVTTAHPIAKGEITPIKTKWAASIGSIKLSGFTQSTINFYIGSVAGKIYYLQYNPLNKGLLSLATKVALAYTEPSAYPIQYLFLNNKDQTLIYQTYGDGSTKHWIGKVTRATYQEPPVVINGPVSLWRVYIEQANSNVNRGFDILNLWESDLSLGFAKIKGNDVWGILTMDLQTGKVTSSPFPNVWFANDTTTGTTGAFQFINSKDIYSSVLDCFINAGISDDSSLDDRIFKIFVNRSDVNDIPLTDIITAYCLNAGYDIDDIEFVNFETLKVAGSLITDKQELAPLLDDIGSVYGFDRFESAGKIKFVKQGVNDDFTINHTIPYGDLMAVNDGDAMEYVGIQQRDITDIPNMIELQYIDIGLDYAVGVQYAKRVSFPAKTSDSDDYTSYALPLIMTSTQAFELVQSSLYRSWAGNNLYDIILPKSWIAVEPSDTLKITYNTQNYIFKAEQVVLNGDMSISINGSSIITDYVNNTALPELERDTNDIVSALLTTTLIIDSNLINFSDDKFSDNVSENLTTYALVLPTDGISPTAGAVLEYSDDDKTFNKIQTVENNPVFGYLNSDIPDATSYYGIDETLTLSINIAQGTLYDFFNVTLDQQLQGFNNFLLGSEGRWEIMSFQTFTFDEDINVLTLNNIARGLHGSEINMNLHELGDYFILLNDTHKEIDNNTADLNTDKYLLSYGELVPSYLLTADTYTIEGNAQRPYAPSNIQGHRETNNDITITWSRRDRQPNTVDEDGNIITPLTEASELYDISVRDSDGALLYSTTGLTTSTFTLTAAMQTTAGLSFDLDVIYVKIAQISSIVGSGYAPLTKVWLT